jgi:predicted dehydrogenase
MPYAARSDGRMPRRKFQALALGGVAALSAGRILGANERLQMGVIGCGGRGTAHMHTLLGLRAAGEALDIVAVCDTYRRRREKAVSLTGVPLKTSRHEELLGEKSVDAVLVATPDHWHGFQTLYAMLAGKDVYCEKPLTHWRQFGLPQKLVATAAETKRIVQVGCQRMSSSVYTQARALIRAGDIGQPIIAETGYYRIGDWGERGMPVDDPEARPGPDLDWERFQGDAPKKDFDVSRYFRWRMYWDYSGGPGTDNYVHFYTPLAFMLDLGYPDTVVATGGKYRYEEREVPDTFNMIIDYPQKFAVLCHGTQGNDYQSQGSGDQPIVRGWDGTLTFEGNQIVIRPTSGSTKGEKKETIQTWTSEPEFWKEFLNACRTRTPVKSGIDLAASVATTLQMGIAAMRDRRYVRFDAEKKVVV